MMGIEVAGGTTEFCREGCLNQQFQLVFQSFYKNHQFLSQSGRTGRLSMGTGQHGNVFPLLCQQFQLSVQVQKSGQVFKLQAFFPKQGNGGVVDVLGSQSKMHPFFQFGDAGFFKQFFQEIFHGFHIVVGNRFRFFYFLCILQAKVFECIFQHFSGRGGQREEFFIGQEKEIFNFHPYPILSECEL